MDGFNHGKGEPEAIGCTRSFAAEKLDLPGRIGAGEAPGGAAVRLGQMGSIPRERRGRSATPSPSDRRPPARLLRRSGTGALRHEFLDTRDSRSLGAIRGASARVDGPWQRPDLTLPPKRPVWSQASEVAVGRSRRLGDFFISPLLDRKVDFVVWPHQARTVRFRGYPSCQEDWARPPLLRTADGRCGAAMEDAHRRWKMRSADGRCGAPTKDAERRRKMRTADERCGAPMEDAEILLMPVSA